MRLSRNMWYSFGNAIKWVTDWCINLEMRGLCVESSTCLVLTLLTVRVRLGEILTLKPEVHTSLSGCTAYRVAAAAL